MNNRPANAIRMRITVMLGSSDTDSTTLKILSQLTLEEPAEIHGLFLQDTDLLALAELPVAREFCQLTHAERRLEPADLLRQLRIQARAAEQALAGFAGRSGFNWSFRTVRGSLASLLAEDMGERDLLLLGAARNLRPLAIRQVLPRPASRPVAVTFDGSATAQRALAIARRVASAGSQPLAILLIAADPDSLQALRMQAALLASPAMADYLALGSAEPDELLAAVHAARASTLVIGLREELPPTAIERLHSRMRCPAVLVQ